MATNVTITVHSGGFHADDVFAAAALLLVLADKPVVAHIVRTRDEAIIASADFVADVGGVYDPERNRFDHHQIGGAGARANGVPFAAFGLVWKKYGTTVAGSETVAAYIDKHLVQCIDAMDNGVGELQPIVADVFPYSIFDVVAAFEPSWNEEEPDYDRYFSEAVNFAVQALKREIKTASALIVGEAEARKAYKEAVDKRLTVLLKNYPYKDVFSSFPEPLFVVRPASEKGVWRVDTVRDTQHSFKNRKDLPKSWAGKRNSELTAVTGVADALFCHTKRFVAFAKSKEGAVALAQKALE